MLYTRRDIGRITAAAGAAAPLWAAKPNSKFGGVQIGAITYSFRGLPVADTLKYCLDCGLSAVELMSNVAETFAGAPAGGGGMFGPPPGGMQGGPGRQPGVPPQGGAPGGPGAPGAQGAQRGPGGGMGGMRRQMTPEQQAAMAKAAEETKKWRLSVPMAKYKEFRKIWNDAGVKIYAFKLEPRMTMSDEEFAYIWNVGETLGADHITMELPTDDALLQRVAEYAAKRKLRIAFHTHGQGGSSGFDRALNASPFTALNFDVGHYYGVNGESPVPLIEKYASRISSLHLKDRKGPKAAPEGSRAGAGGPNMPWGQGETPLKEILQVMKQKKFKFPASIEYEYQTPQGSDVLAEMKKCVEYCKAALA